MRTRVAVYLLMCGLLPWAGSKTIWTLGGNALGVAGDDWQRTATVGSSGPAKATASAGIDVTVLAAMVGIFLLLGLLYVWGGRCSPAGRCFCPDDGSRACCP
ncbi:hypothetical protein GCM10020000_81120 [Streptomyces olivoverticillatus]